MAGIPRPTLAHLESGTANPTLSILMRLASTLHVLIEELVDPPRTTAQHFGAEELPQRQRGSVRITKLLPDPVRGLDVERIEIPAGAHLTGIPHARGTRKYVSCETGVCLVKTSDDSHRLEQGELLIFRGDQGHAYHNCGTEVAILYAVVSSAPVPE